MIDAGASAIFGHHPHVVQGVEFYDEVPIFYSLGNFIFSNNIVEPGSDWRRYPPYDFASLQRTISNIGALAKISWASGMISSCSLIPLTITNDGEPVAATADDVELLISRLNTLSKGRRVRFEVKKSEGQVEILVEKS